MLADWLNYEAQLKHYVLKHIDDVDAVDDILQEVFIKASNKQHQLKSKDNLKSWLYRIAHNITMDYHRAKQPHEMLPDNLIDHVEEQAPLQQMAQCITPMFDCLPEKYRLAMILAEVEGLPQQEIANRLGMSLSGAKSRVQRGRVKFKALLMQYCDIEVGQHGVIDYKPKAQCQHLSC